MTYFENCPSVIAIIGSRDYPRLDKVVSFVQKLPPNTILVSGGARGVDKAAETEARKNNLPTKIFGVERFEWERGFNKWVVTDLRNELIARYVKRALGLNGASASNNNGGTVIAFWSLDAKTGKFTTGTGNMLGHAQKLNVPYRVYYDTGTEQGVFSSREKPKDTIIDLIPLREDIIRYRDIGNVGIAGY